MEEEKREDSDLVFQYFHRICQFPRSTGHEERIGRALVAMGEELGLSSRRDPVGNVFIDSPASAGWESAPPLILQAHMDMVGMKEAGSPHDFRRDPIQLQANNGWLTAVDTSLGADDGIGMALALAFLASGLPHPPLRLIFTVGEEMNMTGARFLSKEDLKAPFLINLDAEIEGKVSCSCAGESLGLFQLPVRRFSPSDPLTGLSIEISHMKGGHSGRDIMEVSNSALTTICDFLYRSFSYQPFFIHSIQSGRGHNAIPSQARAVISFPPSQLKQILEACNRARDDINHSLLRMEPDIQFEWNTVEVSDDPMEEESSKNLLKAVMTSPHGVYSMMEEGEGVATSSTLAILDTDRESASLLFSLRFMEEGKRKELEEKIQRNIRAFKGRGHFDRNWSPWAFKEDSPLRRLLMTDYEELFGHPLQFLVSHSGIECSIFAEKRPELDMVSLGPDIRQAHTTGEKLDMDSARRTFQLLVKVIADIGKVWD